MINKSDREEILRHCYQAMGGGSLTFAFASAILGRKTRDDVVQLYAWCRYADDVADTPSADRSEAFARLTELSFSDENETLLPIPVHAFREVRSRHNISIDVAREHLEGMNMDLNPNLTYESWDDLRLYCYRVAGVVGLMLSPILGARNSVAHKHAIDLGIAMQLTNICRDLVTDAELGRVYIPTPWLNAAGISTDAATTFFAKERAQLTIIARQLFDAAESHYASGRAGLRYLPFRTSIAIAVAGDLYREIGVMVLERGVSAWDTRTWVPFSRKCRVAIRSVLRVVRTRIAQNAAQLISRFQHPQRKGAFHDESY